MSKEYKQNDMYVVELSDMEWYGAPEAIRDELEAVYRDHARQQMCSLVAVFVIPDPIFPMCDKRTKHKVYEARFPASDKTYSIAATFVGEIDNEIYFKASEHDRGVLVRKVRDELNEYARGVAGRYFINTSTGVLIEKGRV